MQELKLVITVDVEEEGLFRGQYARSPAGLESVAQLGRLEFISRELGLPLTLLCTYAVARDQASQQVLASWRDELGAEIGAHLHPWSTPPFGDPIAPEPHRAPQIPPQRLEAKLESLLAALQQGLGTTARSFRMGRFDITPGIWALLPARGIQVDSSIAPLRWVADGPDRFLAPYDPYWLTPAGPGGGRLLVAPLTQVPLLSGSERLVRALGRGLPAGMGRRLLASFKYWGVVGVQPALFPAASMRQAARLHAQRGGQVLTMFLHSSELLAGATPNFPSEQSVQALVDKLRGFLQWLLMGWPIRGLTLGQLYQEMA